MLSPGPSYISSRSADVILSDVRPIKLAYEALQAVNVLLDELLYTILNEAQSLATDKLKASLLKVIPTNLGKEALLEAEVELKAYLERNTSSSTSGSRAGGPFSLQWAFELLRLKCEAYSTMNDSDEDGDAERRLSERMKGSNMSPPHPSEVAPAALYLTAILEYAHSLFVFRASLICSHGAEGLYATRAPWRAQERALIAVLRQEDEELAHEFDELMRSGSTVKVSLTPDRLRTMEVFNRERTQRAKQTREPESQISDKPAGTEGDAHALPSERPRAPASAARPLPRRVDSIVEDEEEFTQASSTTITSATVVTTEPPRMRQASKSFTSSSAPSSAAARYRSISISDSPHPRHESRRSQDRLPNGMPANLTAIDTQKPSRQPSKSNPTGMPTRTKKVARHRESLDLDDVMNGSGEEGEEEEVPIPSLPPPPPRTPSRTASAAPTPISPAKPQSPHVSASARELIAFLDEGPPEEPESQRNSVANASVISFESSKTARTGKLSRMMSKLTIGNGGSQERLNGRYGDDPPKTPRSLGRKPSTNFGPPTAFKSSLSSKRSFPNVVVSPPRVAPHHGDGTQTPTPPQSISSSTRMVSPSPTNSTAPLNPRTVSVASSTSDESHALSPLRNGSVRKTWDDHGSEVSMSRNGSVNSQSQGSRVSHRLQVVNGDMREDEHGPLTVKTNGHVPIISPVPRSNDDRVVSPSTPRRSPIPRKPPPSPNPQENGHAPAKDPSQRSRKPSTSPAPAPGIAASEVADLRQYLSKAQTADECRLLVDMFFASHGFPAKALSDDEVPSLPELPLFMSLSELESSYVELFLSGDSIGFPSLADETSSDGSSASSRDFLSPSSEPNASPAPFLETVQE
ncbi:hypothetical protein EVJ58_g7650 [Rhodofomes roseus]|uniref:Uncharacterized protein n=1 Tax=Rhodofomes roseus TaxID=34475 RepID=A0A4Y9Y6J2_9APHY|nr:hypothetical protein EVJ58_g7650 [Rhodofomes roseus]